jgi:hypothetical protein
MSYAERVAASTERPACWGSKDAFRPEDDECDECRFQHTCRAEVERKTSGLYSIRPSTSYRPSSSSSSSVGKPSSNYYGSLNWAPGPVDENDNPIKRFFKDALVGGLHGLFTQMARFFEGWRWK